jgi:hypothetical protein
MKPTELSRTFGSMDGFLFQRTQHYGQHVSDPHRPSHVLQLAAVNDGLDLQFFGQLDELTSDGTQRRIPLLAK